VVGFWGRVDCEEAEVAAESSDDGSEDSECSWVIAFNASGVSLDVVGLDSG